MKLLTLNVLCGEFWDPLPFRRLTKQAEKIVFLSPDVVCLQEVNNPFVRRVLGRGLEHRYRFVDAPVSTTIVLSRLVVFLFFVAVNRSIVLFLGLLSVWLFFLGTAEGGLVILVSRDLPVNASGFIPFHEQRGDVLNFFQKRGVLWVETPLGVVGNTHLNRYHRHQSQIDQLAGAKDWWLLAGDLNTDRVAAVTMKRLATGPTYANDTIDHVWVRSGEWEATCVDLCSDHSGIFVKKISG